MLKLFHRNAQNAKTSFENKYKSHFEEGNISERFYFNFDPISQLSNGNGVVAFKRQIDVAGRWFLEKGFYFYPTNSSTIVTFFSS